MNELYSGEYDYVCIWLYNKLDELHSHGHGSEFIIKIAYRYIGEKGYIEENQIVWFDSEDHMLWLDDWWEGQQDIMVLGYVPVEDIELGVMIHGGD